MRYSFILISLIILLGCESSKTISTSNNIQQETDEIIQTTSSAAQLVINANGEDLSFITVKITDKNGLMVPDASNKVAFSIEGPGEIIATDNGDPASLVSFASKEREAYFGMLLVIIRSEKGKPGVIKISASSPGLKDAVIEIKSK
jgi:beta-galactosidase